MSKKNRLYPLAFVFLLSSVLLMTVAKGILAFTQAGPDAPRIAHYYSYLDPHVYFAGGMYFAPLAVILAAVSLITLIITMVKRNRGKVSLYMSAACLICLLVVIFNRPITVPNIFIGILTLLSTCTTWLASCRL